MSNGAMTLAEGSQKKDYRTDATMVLNGNTERGYVLRTAYDPITGMESEIWQRHLAFLSALEKRHQRSRFDR